MAGYNRVTDAVAASLQGICGADNVVYGDPKKLDRFSRDQVADPHYAHAPEAAVSPASAREVAAVIKLAAEHRIPVTPRGAGSGLSGGAVPVHGGIVITFDRMDTILEIAPDNLFAVVEPGLVTNKLDEALKPYGLFFAGYPMSEEFCRVGGNVAENAGGGRAIKYGVTGQYILGLEVVTPAGEIVQLGGKRIKDVTGYDLVKLLVGSEGTLGVFTKIFIKLLPRPEHRLTCLALFPSAAAAVGTVPAIMTKGKFLPTSIEFMDRISMFETCTALKETVNYADAGAMMLYEVDGTDPSVIKGNMDVIRATCEAAGATDLYSAATGDEIERFWKIRKRVPWTIKRMGALQSLEDIVVPIAAIPPMLQRIEALADKYATRIPAFGHAGDGNLHAVPVKSPEQSDEAWAAMLPELLTELYREAMAMGGCISGEHGIGHKRKKYLQQLLDPAAVNLMRGIKKAWDPRNIMNPGKIFDL